MKKFICKQCKCEFLRTGNRVRFFCSQSCTYKSKIGVKRPKYIIELCIKKRSQNPTWVANHKNPTYLWNGITQETHRKMSLSRRRFFERGGKVWNTDKKMSDSYKESLKKAHEFEKGERNPNWRGDNIRYDTIHDWVTENLGKPKKCWHCGKDGLTGSKIHWANKSGRYLRDLDDWIRLCAKCHRNYDLKNNTYADAVYNGNKRKILFLNQTR